MLTTNHFGHYDVRPRLGMWVVYDLSGDSPRPAVFRDGNPVIYACAFDAYIWIALQINRRLAEVKS